MAGLAAQIASFGLSHRGHFYCYRRDDRFKQRPQNSRPFSAELLILFFIAGQVPYILFINQYSPIHLGLWTNALKEMALAGGALVIAHPAREYLSRMGSILFAITIALFGIDHFYYTEFVATLVPAWIPGPVFWTYFAGIALAGAGVAIIIRFKLKTIALLLATMLFLWFLFLHIPRAWAHPSEDQGNEVTSVLEALGFTGIALAIACMRTVKE